MLDNDDRLSVANARRLLAMLDQREENFQTADAAAKAAKVARPS
jgi:hypothetical protein